MSPRYFRWDVPKEKSWNTAHCRLKTVLGGIGWCHLATSQLQKFFSAILKCHLHSHWQFQIREMTTWTQVIEVKLRNRNQLEGPSGTLHQPNIINFSSQLEFSQREQGKWHKPSNHISDAIKEDLRRFKPFSWSQQGPQRCRRVVGLVIWSHQTLRLPLEVASKVSKLVAFL